MPIPHPESVVQSKVLTVVDRSTIALNNATNNLKKVMSDLDNLIPISTQLITDVEFKQNELDNLSQTLIQKEREANADLRIRIKENETGVLNELLVARELTSLPIHEHRTLLTELDLLKKDNEIAISTAVKVAQNQLESVHKSTLERQESSHQVEIATLKANNESLQERNEFLQSQISTLQEQIASEREARISIAQAESAKQGVVINTGK